MRVGIMKNKLSLSIILLICISISNNFCTIHKHKPRSYFSKKEVFTIKKVSIIPSERVNDYIIDKLSAYIGSIAKFELVEPSLVKKKLDELNLKYSDIINPNIMNQIRDIFGLDGIIIISYMWKQISTSRRSISLNAKLIELETGLILWQAEKSIEADSFNLVPAEDNLCKFIASTLYVIK